MPHSGTRSRATHWKSGFLHIARRAQVPILCAYLDYRRRASGISPLIDPTGIGAIDMPRIRVFYETISAKYPELTTPVRLAEEGPG